MTSATRTEAACLASAMEWKPWASVTFSGARVRLPNVNLSEDDYDLDVPGVLIADIYNDGDDCELLLLADPEGPLDRDAVTARLSHHIAALTA